MPWTRTVAGSSPLRRAFKHASWNVAKSNIPYMKRFCFGTWFLMYQKDTDVLKCAYCISSKLTSFDPINVRYFFFFHFFTFANHSSVPAEWNRGISVGIPILRTVIFMVLCSLQISRFNPPHSSVRNVALSSFLQMSPKKKTCLRFAQPGRGSSKSSAVFMPSYHFSSNKHTGLV